jgi:glycosyltransferase involved in cell wall biosynthesis
MSSPVLSIVVVAFNMERELPRTLFSLSPAYQRGIGSDDYEVIVVDNGSTKPLSPREVERFGSNFRILDTPRASPSPVAAINLGAALARGQFVGIMIDGARLLTPGVLRHTLAAIRAYDDPVVATLSWHLGPDLQSRAVERGYSKHEEDRLLTRIDWQRNGYRLFEIASLAGSSDKGWFLPIAESNCLFSSRQRFERLGGYDERFDLPGGGLANLDFYARVCEDPGAQLVILLGEGSFHQLHGGVATNATAAEHAIRWRAWTRQYMELRHKPYVKPVLKPEYLGALPASAARWLVYSAQALSEANSPRNRVLRGLGRLRRGARALLLRRAKTSSE